MRVSTKDHPAKSLFKSGARHEGFLHVLTLLLLALWLLPLAVSLICGSSADIGTRPHK